MPSVEMNARIVNHVADSNLGQMVDTLKMQEGRSSRTPFAYNPESFHGHHALTMGVATHNRLVTSLPQIRGF